MHRWEDEFHEVLTEHFRRLKDQDPKFSLRALAKRARISPSAMSQLLRKNNGWQLSVERAIDVLSSLEVDERKKNRLIALMGQHVPVRRSTLNTTDYEELGDWIYLPILHSFDLTPSPSCATIARKLGLDISKVQSAVNELADRGYLKKLEDGHYVREAPDKKQSDRAWLKTSPERQKTNFEIAARSGSRQNQVFLTATFAGNRTQIELLKNEIEKLFDFAAAVVENTDPRDEIFELSVQLFPLDFQKED